MQQEFGLVALLMGGWSAERDVSLKSGAAVLAALRRLGINVEAIDMDIDIVRVLQEGHYSRIFNIVHGRGGEDGKLQALLEFLNLPYTGTGVLGCALGMDKMRCKNIWQGKDLPTPAAMIIKGEKDCEKALMSMKLPLAVKPVFEGSSVGISKVKIESELLPAWREASKYGEVMAECWIEGTEYTVSILAGAALPAIRLQPAREFYDFTAKYADGSGTQYYCPCGLDLKTEQSIQKLALAAFDAIDGYGWGRIDLMLDNEDQPWLIEVNTVPGMTDHSLVPMSAKNAGIEFDELVLKILRTSLGDRSKANAS
ncbi:MAG: D-alanine--D-alanine ligase [Gammaproteobacteria bacterium]|nr:D-alanine--D-alanine ligase [Gammaproteobacteria bacterium]